MEVKPFLLILFPFFLLACETQKQIHPQKLEDGIYLIADSSQAGALQLPCFDTTRGMFFVDTNQWLDRDNFMQITVFENMADPVVNVNLTECGSVRRDYARFMNEGKPFALIVENRIFSIGTFPSDTNDEYYNMEMQWMGPFRNPDNSESLFNDKKRNKDVRIEDDSSLVRPKLEYYANGKLFSETKYRNRKPYWSTTYYENGDLYCEKKDDTLTIDSLKGTSFEKFYYPGEQPHYLELTGNDGPMLSVTYYRNGILKSDSREFKTIENEPSFIRDYDPNGILVHQDSVEYLRICGEGHEFNFPQVIHAKYFRNGQLSESGDIYSDCGGECNWDSAGVWKFYNDGKLIAQRNFPSVKEQYARYCGAQK